MGATAMRGAGGMSQPRRASLTVRGRSFSEDHTVTATARATLSPPWLLPLDDRGGEPHSSSIPMKLISAVDRRNEPVRSSWRKAWCG